MAWLEQARARSSRSTSGTATACQRRSHRSMSWMSNLLAPALLAGCSGVHTIPTGSVAWAERHEQGERVGPGKSTTRAQTDRCRTQCADEHVLSVPTCAAIAESTLPTRSPSTRRARPPSSHRESAVTTGSRCALDAIRTVLLLVSELTCCSRMLLPRRHTVRIRRTDKASLPQEGKDDKEGRHPPGMHGMQVQGAAHSQAHQALRARVRPYLPLPSPLRDQC